MPDYNLRRVIYHELGHFIAHEIIKERLGIHGLGAILITPVGNDYTGDSMPIVPEGYNDREEISHPAELIVELAYGCYIQALYVGDGYESCFYAPGHGMADISTCSKILREFGSEKKHQVFELIRQYYYNKINGNSALKELLPSSTEIEGYMDGQKDGKFSVDLTSLRAVCDELIEVHQDCLLQLIEDIKCILKV